MKKKLIIIMLLVVSFLSVGCLKRDTFEDINVYTTVYPLEYILAKLYGEHSTVKSIYPSGVIIDKYEITDKQIKDYSSSANLFVFNGLTSEKDYVIPMITNNDNMKIIDASLSMEYNNGVEELWLDPSNFLMLSQNIRTGLNEYISNHYLKNEIEANYEQLKIDVSNLDAKLKIMANNADNLTIVVDSDTFKYLEKYGFKVISLEENDNLTDKTIADVKKLINDKAINYIFIKQNNNVNDTIKTLIEGKDIQTVELHALSNLSESERNEKKDYLTLMDENIEKLRAEVYN